MYNQTASIWNKAPSIDIIQKTDGFINQALGKRENVSPIIVYFRADDIGVPGLQFSRLMDIFRNNHAPLSLAVVPAWMTSNRWKQLKDAGRGADTLFCWHQHGWRHANHEPSGKKQEFGPGRPLRESRRDLVHGYERLKNIMENRYTPIFTPPWNRCCSSVLKLIQELGYLAVSGCDDNLKTPPGLHDFPVGVDLHTRKEAHSKIGWSNLENELQKSINLGRCGIMIHHQRMNDAAFAFLEKLLQMLKKHQGIRLCHFGELTSD